MDSRIANGSLRFLRQWYAASRKVLSPLQMVLLQQLCFCVVFIVTSPIYNLTLDLNSLINAVESANTQPAKLQDLKTIVEVFQEQVHLPQVFIFSNVIVFIAFFYTLSTIFGNSKSRRVTIQSSIIVFGIITWVLLCFHVFIPLRFSCSSGLQKGVLSFIKHPISSLFVMIMFSLSVPFSMVADHPLTFSTETLSIVNGELAKTFGNKMVLPPTTDLSIFFNISYKWSNLLPLFMFIGSCVTLIMYADYNKSSPSVDGCGVTAEVIRPGSVRRLSKNFENKKKPPPVLEKPKIQKPLIVEEEIIKPVTASPLAESKPKTPVTLAKVRPVNVTKPLQFKNIQDVPTTAVLGSASQDSVPVSVRHENADNLCADKKPKLVDAGETKCVMKCEKSVQFSQILKENSSQTTSHTTKEAQSQCEIVETRCIGEQTNSVRTSDKAVSCEILSQERYVKLQQSALALYKKTVEQKDYTYASLPKKVHISSNVTKFNKAIQVNFKLPDEKKESFANGHSKATNGIPEIKINDNQLSKEIQTDLFGYVLDKIIQERETSNLYSKLDVERTVHSVLTLSEKVKQHTETIRFKAMKSQHGVWYVSLRGDIFLTISQDILKNVKLNAERKIETDVSSDILRAMKLFIDNYNKLSDCFDDDEESDDESFINGFRL